MIDREGLIDVTRPLRSGHPNWPGDAPLELSATARIADGASVNVSSLRTSLHAGTHVDAPWHYDDDGVRLGGLDLTRWVGEALVLDVAGTEAPVGAEAPVGGDAPVDAEAPVDAAALARALTAVVGTSEPKALPARWLLRTGQPDDWGTTFPTAIRALTPDAIAFAAERGVVLLGTDAPSVDPLTSKDLPGHGACARHDVAILEGLALAAVAPGHYELWCLPLSLPDADGAPARAVLRTLP